MAETIRLGDVLVKQSTTPTPSAPSGRTTISFPTGTAKKLLKMALEEANKYEVKSKPKKHKVEKKT